MINLVIVWFSYDLKQEYRKHFHCLVWLHFFIEYLLKNINFNKFGITCLYWRTLHHIKSRCNVECVSLLWVYKLPKLIWWRFVSFIVPQYRIPGAHFRGNFNLKRFIITIGPDATVTLRHSDCVNFLADMFCSLWVMF